MLNDAAQSHALLLISRLAAFGMLITSLEYMFARNVLRDDGPMSWPIGSLRQAWLAQHFSNPVLNSVLRYPNIFFVLFIRAFFAFAILCGVNHPSLVMGIALLTILFLLRNPYGHDGADQMLLIIFAALSLVALDNTPFTRLIFFWFLTFQACLAYSVAGFAKLSARGWRDGSYLTAICGTSIYGHAGLARVLREKPIFARITSRSLILWECSFPLALLAPPPVAYALIGTGLVFHLVNAYVMGLNTFLFAFVATYPAILFCVQSRIV
jgi:hypothetical protein